MVDFDFLIFFLMWKGNCYQDFEDGQVFEYYWGCILIEVDNVFFVMMMLCFILFYFNVEYVKVYGYDGVVFDLFLVLCMVVGFLVEDFLESGGFFFGVNDVVFYQVMSFGDMVIVKSMVVDWCEFGLCLQFGIVIWKMEVFNQCDEFVLSYQCMNLVVKCCQKKMEKKIEEVG